MRVVFFRNVFSFFVCTTFGHNLHRIEPNMCGCDLSTVFYKEEFGRDGFVQAAAPSGTAA